MVWGERTVSNLSQIFLALPHVGIAYKDSFPQLSPRANVIKGAWLIWSFPSAEQRTQEVLLLRVNMAFSVNEGIHHHSLPLSRATAFDWQWSFLFLYSGLHAQEGGNCCCDCL